VIRLVVCVMACLLVLDPASLHAQSDSLRLESGRAGRFVIGMTVDEVHSLVGRNNVRLVDRSSRDMESPAIEITLPDGLSPSIVAPIRKWPCPTFSLWGIEVFDPRFRTAAGIGVGSKLRELRSNHSVRLSDENGPHAWVEDLYLNFQLQNGSRADSVRVTSVWIPIRDPAAVRAARCPQLGPIRTPARFSPR
jgi:hypothetical protein